MPSCHPVPASPGPVPVHNWDDCLCRSGKGMSMCAKSCFIISIISSAYPLHADQLVNVMSICHTADHSASDCGTKGRLLYPFLFLKVLIHFCPQNILAVQSHSDILSHQQHCRTAFHTICLGQRRLPSTILHNRPVLLNGRQWVRVAFIYVCMGFSCI